MIRSEIIEMANQLTERKGEKILNLGTLYRVVLQDICKRQRFWWRRIQINFSLTIGTSSYDLSTITTVPALALAEIALDEITKFALITSTNPLQTAELSPIFDPEAVIEMQNNTQNSQPGGYTMKPGDYKTLLIGPPDKAYNAFIIGWGMPNPASDTTTEAVPLIPPWGHNTVISGLMVKIFKYQYGSKNPKTIDAQEEYEQGLADLMQKKQFDPNYTLQLTLNESAVRST